MLTKRVHNSVLVSNLRPLDACEGAHVHTKRSVRMAQVPRLKSQNENDMTPDERKMLNDLADKIAQTPAPPRDPEAEDLIRTRIGSRPDALYLMTQTVLIQNMALQQAQQQIQELQRGAGQPSSSGSFLGQGQSRGGGGAYQGSSYQGGGYQAGAAPPPPQYLPPTPSAPSPGGAPGFLRGAAQTAAGVAAGALAFEGIRSLFSHDAGYGFGGPGLGGFGGGAPVEETVVNNYYESPTGADQGVNTGNDFVDPGLSDANDQYSDANQFDDSSLDIGDDSGGFDGGSDDFS